MQTSLFGKHLSIEYRNGTGIDIEFCDSRPVWVHNTDTGETDAMPFMGTVILLPLLVITYGNVYTEQEE
jgi:hypothetical protein